MMTMNESMFHWKTTEAIGREYDCTHCLYSDSSQFEGMMICTKKHADVTDRNRKNPCSHYRDVRE